MDHLNPNEWYNVPDHLLPFFLHHCMDRICGRNGGGLKQLVPVVFRDEDTLETAVELCQHSLIQWIDIRDKKDITISVPDERKKVMYECLECRRPELRTGLVDGILRNSRKGFVVDFDWKVNYVFSSSSLSGINEPIAVVTLLLSNNQTCTLDLSLNEMDLLIQTLKQAQTSLPD